MGNVIILGANGQIAQVAYTLLLERTDFSLTLFARNSDRLGFFATQSSRVKFVEGDVLDKKKLEEAIEGHDIVYANLDGDLVPQAENIIQAMKKKNVKRLIFISSMGIYNEVPCQGYNNILDPYRDSVALIEKSDLDYTIIRPEWLNNNDEIDYELTRKGEVFKNPKKYVSRKSVGDLIVKLMKTSNYEIRESLGINKT